MVLQWKEYISSARIWEREAGRMGTPKYSQRKDTAEYESEIRETFKNVCPLLLREMRGKLVFRSTRSAGDDQGASERIQSLRVVKCGCAHALINPFSCVLLAPFSLVFLCKSQNSSTCDQRKGVPSLSTQWMLSLGLSLVTAWWEAPASSEPLVLEEPS